MIMKECIVFCGPIFLLPKEIREIERKTNCKQYTVHMGMHIHMEIKCAKENIQTEQTQTCPHSSADFYSEL